MTTETHVTTAEEVIERWKTEFLAGDTDALAALYEDDAVLFVPAFGVRAVGREAIREAFAGLFQRYEMQAFEIPSDSLIVSGDYAIVHRTFTMTLRDRESGEVMTSEVPATEVFHRGADGGWRYHIDHA